MRDFAKRGLTPQWEESLSALRLTESGTTNSVSMQLQPILYTSRQTYTQDDSEITFVTYAGDLDNWEGLIYVRTPYEEATYASTFYTPTDDGTNWDEVSEVYYPSDGSDPQCDPRMPCIMQKRPPARNLRMINIAHASVKALPATAGFWGWVRRWWGCVNSVCSWSDFLCIGRTRFICRVGMCVGSLFGCIFWV